MHVYMFTNCRKGTILYPGIKEQIFVSIFQLSFRFIYLLYKCVGTRVLFVWKMEDDLWVSGPTFHSVNSKNQTPVIRFGRKCFQPLRWLSLSF